MYIHVYNKTSICVYVYIYIYMYMYMPVRAWLAKCPCLSRRRHTGVCYKENELYKSPDLAVQQQKLLSDP